MSGEDIGQAVADIGDFSEQVRSEAIELLRTAGKPALFPLINALDSPSPLQRREAARLIALIANDLARSFPPEIIEERPRQLPTEIVDLVVALEDPEKLWWQAAERELNQRREEAFPIFVDRLKTKAAKRPDRIVRLLGEWGELRAVGPLLDAWDAGGSNYMVLTDALRRLAVVVPHRPLELTDAELLRFVIFARQELGISAAPLGDGICRRATLRPTRALRLLLPYLKGRLLHPVPDSFEKARQAILGATKDLANLPMPAEEAEISDQLPRPAESVSDSTGLPKPTERVS